MLARTLAVVATSLVACPLPLHAQVDALAPSERERLRGAYEDARHRVVARCDGGFDARSYGQQYRAHFDGAGLCVEPDGSDWTFRLSLVAWGRGGELVAVDAPLDVQGERRRVAYRWDDGLTEWFVNGATGVEHGFTLERAPSSSGTLVFELEAVGLRPARLVDDDRSAVFVDSTGADALRYAGLHAFDAAGRALDARLVARAGGIVIEVDDRDARYPITIDPVVQQAFLKASNADAGDEFGAALAIAGDTIVVGAPGEASAATGVGGNHADDSAPDAGAAYVFVLGPGGWQQEAYLKASNTDAGDRFGADVAIHGDTIVVAAAAEDGNATGIDGDDTDDSAAQAGAVYVFTRTGSIWTQQAYVKASNTDAGDAFGSAVALDGDTLVVGALFEDSAATGVGGDESDDTVQQSGAAYVYTRAGTTWTQQAYIKASNTGVGDSFGYATGLCGDTLVVGAYLEDSAATGVDGDETDDSALSAGAAFVFQRSGAVWSQQAYLKASNAGGGDFFGRCVAISDDTVAVGALFERSSATGIDGDGSDNSLIGAGAAYVFHRTGSTWSEQAYVKASNTQAGNSFGTSVAVDGDTLVVGSIGEASGATGANGNQFDTSAPHSGAAYVFVRSGADWTQQVYLKASNTDANDVFGRWVAVRGDTVVVGADGEASAVVGGGPNPNDDSAPDAGAAYVVDLGFFEVVEGCFRNTASISQPTGAARIGTTVAIEILGCTTVDGVVATYYGAKQLDASACGVLLSPGEELLLAVAPLPTLLGLAAMTSGAAEQPLAIPNNPGLVGFHVTLQAVAVDTTTFASEFSTALEFEIRP